MIASFFKARAPLAASAFTGRQLPVAPAAAALDAVRQAPSIKASAASTKGKPMELVHSNPTQAWDAEFAHVKGDQGFFYPSKDQQFGSACISAASPLVSWNTSGISNALVVAGIGAVTFAEWGTTSSVRAEQEPEKIVFTLEECQTIESVLSEGAAILKSYADAPDSWWDEGRMLKPSLEGDELKIMAKKLPTFSTRLFMLRARLQDVTLEEFVLSCECGAGTRRAVWDTSVERAESIGASETAAFAGLSQDCHPVTSVMRCYTYPALLGMISRRVVDDISITFCRLPGDPVRCAHFGIGVRSHLVDQAISKLQLGDAAQALINRLRENSHAAGAKSHVVMVDHVAGVMVQRLAPNSLLVEYVIHSDASGGIPAWACDKGVAQALEAIYKNIRKDVIEQRKLPLDERLRGRSLWPTAT